MSTPVIFLPGILMPAALRYAPLIRELGTSVHPITKDLEVYRDPQPPPDYSIDMEVAGVSRVADGAKLKQFHLYGHSGGGAVAIAYVAAHPERVLTLAVDEPAFDFTPADQTEMKLQTELQGLDSLPPAERMAAFARSQLKAGVALPAPPPGPPPPWMASRPDGVVAFIKASRLHVIDPDQLRSFTRPVYYSLGSRSADIWEARRQRLADLFPNFTSELYEGLHHLNTSHVAEPSRVAASLRKLWN